MTISEIQIKKVSSEKGLLGFCSFVVDGWFYVGNVAIFSRRYKEGEIRLVFPEKKVKGKLFKLCYPRLSDSYFELEKLIKDNFYKI